MFGAVYGYRLPASLWHGFVLPGGPVLVLTTGDSGKDAYPVRMQDAAWQSGPIF